MMHARIIMYKALAKNKTVSYLLRAGAISDMRIFAPSGAPELPQCKMANTARLHQGKLGFLSWSWRLYLGHILLKFQSEIQEGFVRIIRRSQMY